MKHIRAAGAFALALILFLSPLTALRAEAAATYVAEIVGRTKFETFDELFAAVEDGDTVKLHANLTLKSTSKLTVGGESSSVYGANGNGIRSLTITDDGTARTINCNTGSAITVGSGGTLTLKASAAGRLKVATSYSGGISSAGILVNSGGTLIADTLTADGLLASASNKTALFISCYGTAHLSGVTAVDCALTGGSLIYLGRNASMDMKSCSITAPEGTNAVYADKSDKSDSLSAYAHLTVDSATVLSPVYLQSGCAVALSDAEHMSDGYVDVTLAGGNRAVQVVDCRGVSVTAEQLAAHFRISGFTESESLFWATEDPFVGRLVTREFSALSGDKERALLATAYAYYNQGNTIQYDMYGERRMVDMAPEEATAERDAYLDCSSYVDSVIYQTFLKSDGQNAHVLRYKNSDNQPTTERFKDYARDYNENKQNPQPDVVFYEYHAEGTSGESFDLETLRDTLQAGDLLNYRKASGGGHVMLYLGDNTFLHCSGTSFDYCYTDSESGNSVDCSASVTSADPRVCSDNAAAFEKDYGAVGLLDASDLFDESGCRYLNKTTSGSVLAVTHINVLRPLAVSSNTCTVTFAALARTAAPGLSAELSASVPYLRSVRAGDTLTYTLTLKNYGTETVSGITLSALAPEYTAMVTDITKDTVSLAAGQTKAFDFTVRVSDSALGKTVSCGEGVTVSVGGGVIRANTVRNTVTTALPMSVSAAAALNPVKSSHGWGSIEAVWANLGIALPYSEYKQNAVANSTDPNKKIYDTPARIFPDLIDDEGNTCLTRDVTDNGYTNTLCSLLVPGLYGGTVICNGMKSDNERIRALRTDYLEPGDIILVSNGRITGGQTAFAYLYVSEELLFGTNLPYDNDAASVAPSMLLDTGEEVSAFFERILAFSRFAVLRPSLLAGNSFTYTLSDGTLTVSSCTVSSPLLCLADYTADGQLLRVQRLTVGVPCTLTGDHAALFLLDRDTLLPLQFKGNIKE